MLLFFLLWLYILGSSSLVYIYLNVAYKFWTVFITFLTTLETLKRITVVSIDIESQCFAMASSVWIS